MSISDSFLISYPVNIIQKKITLQFVYENSSKKLYFNLKKSSNNIFINNSY